MREKWRLQCVLHRAKLLVAFTLVVVCTCHARALGQNDRISLHVNDAALSDVLRQIEDLSGYMFVYKSGDIEQAGRVTLKAENMAVSTILEKCFADTGLSYAIENGVIAGGLGSSVLEFMADHGYTPFVKRIGVPDQFIEHGSIPELYKLCGMDADSIAGVIRQMCTVSDQ